MQILKSKHNGASLWTKKSSVDGSKMRTGKDEATKGTLLLSLKEGAPKSHRHFCLNPLGYTKLEDRLGNPHSRRPET